MGLFCYCFHLQSIFMWLYSVCHCQQTKWTSMFFLCPVEMLVSEVWRLNGFTFVPRGVLPHPVSVISRKGCVAWDLLFYNVTQCLVMGPHHLPCRLSIPTACDWDTSVCFMAQRKAYATLPLSGTEESPILPICVSFRTCFYLEENSL